MTNDKKGYVYMMANPGNTVERRDLYEEIKRSLRLLRRPPKNMADSSQRRLLVFVYRCLGAERNRNRRHCEERTCYKSFVSDEATLLKPARLLIVVMALMFLSSAAHAEVTDGLVGWWKFDEASGNAVDSSGNGNTGTPTGTTISSDCRRNNCRDFNGSSDFVDAGSAASLDIANGGSVTMCAWVSADTPGSWQSIMAKRDDNSYAYGINFSNGSLQVYTSGSSGIQSFVIYMGPIWTHICATMSGGPTELYINGALWDTEGSGGGVASMNTETLKIGKSSAGSASEYFDGKLDDVRVYNRVLSAAEVKEVYESRAPVGWWKLDDGSGTTATDSSSIFGATAHNGTLTNGPTWSTGPRGGAAFFDGSSSDYILIGHAPALQLATFTVMFWVYPTNLSMGFWQPLVTKTDAVGSNRNFGMYLHTSSPIVHYSLQSHDCSSYYSYNTTGNITANQWTHIAMTYDGTVLRLYMNGALDSSQSIGIVPCRSTDPVRITEASGTFNTLYGKIDDVQIYDHALSRAEIWDAYQGGSQNFGGE